MNEEKATRDEVIEFLVTKKRSPSTKIEEEKRIKRAFHGFVYDKKDAEIIALKNKFAENTKRHSRTMMSKTVTGESIEERVARIRDHYEKTGKYFDSKTSYSADYAWINGNKHISEEVAKLWEDIHKEEVRRIVKPEKSEKPMEKPTTSIEAKKVSDLTLCEVSKLLKLIGEKTVAELIAKPSKPKEPEKVDISKLETILPEDIIRKIINPDNTKVVVANPTWKRAKELLEYVYASEVLKTHLASKMLFDNPVFTQEIIKLVMENPKKTFYHKEKIVERIFSYLPSNKVFFENPANIRDLVINCF